MSDLILAADSCDRCGAELAVDTACENCGDGQHTLAAVEVLPPITAKPAAALVGLRGESLLDNRLAVFGILLVAGPLGLPALWFSRRFSRATKIATTVVFFLLTVVVPIVGAWYCFEVLLRPLVDAMVGANAS